MKTDRLIGILSILLQKESVTAPELAQQFEVSRRTISRDIDALCMAGIPIATSQGYKGGIRIMDGYRMDRTILTSKDMQMILAGLRSLDSVSGSAYYGQLMEKLQAGSSQYIDGKQSILIDLSSWNRGMLAEKIGIVLDAIENRHLLSFDYYSPKGISQRLIEPYYLLFHWSSWYVWGWCLEKNDLRLFKLGRTDRLKDTGTSFICREVGLPDLSEEKVFGKGIHTKIFFDEDVRWRLVEEFGPGSFKEIEEGKLLFENDDMDEENLFSWLLTFADKAEVLEPESLRQKMKQHAQEMLKKYAKE